MIQDLIYCEKCNLVFQYLSRQSGTTTLNNHTCIDEKFSNSQNSNIDAFFVKKKKPITADDRKNVNKSSLKFVAKDLRPCHALAGDGLVDLLVTFTELGQKYGRFTIEEIKDVLPSPATVSFSSNMKIFSIIK